MALNRRLSMTRFVVAAFALSMLVVAGCETVPGTEAGRDALQDQSQTTLREMTTQDPSLQEVLDRSVGYAVFPDVGKGGFIVGGAYGRGIVYERGRMIGYADISQASVGLQAGGQSFSQLIVFMTQDALNRLQGGKFDVGANAEAVALTAGIAREANFERGVAVFVVPRGGLMAGISVQGQILDFVPLEAAAGTGVREERYIQQERMDTDVRLEGQMDQRQYDTDVEIRRDQREIDADVEIRRNQRY
jgi:lipid-binding SYLF domain-containing protein